MLSLNLSPIFKARGITNPYTFLVKAGLSSHAASSLINTNRRALRLDHIEFLCRVLVCEPNDLLLWTPEKSLQYVPNHPLFKLNAVIPVNNWQQTLAALPLQQLREATTNMLNQKNQETNGNVTIK